MLFFENPIKGSPFREIVPEIEMQKVASYLKSAGLPWLIPWHFNLNDYFISAIVILFLVIFLLILMHISQLDDSFCGCVICKLQNDTFCPGMLSISLANSSVFAEPQTGLLLIVADFCWNQQ